MARKTRTQKLADQNAKAIAKQRQGVEQTAQLQIEVRDGKKTAAEALKEKAGFPSHTLTPGGGVRTKDGVVYSNVQPLQGSFWTGMVNSVPVGVDHIRPSERRAFSVFDVAEVLPTCSCGIRLVYQGDIAAPGSGQSWKCPNCDAAYRKLGTTLVRLIDGNSKAPGWKPEQVDPYGYEDSGR